MDGTAVPPGWYADPLHRHEHRYWDGTSWTDQVADLGATGVDPLVAGPPVAPVAAVPAAFAPPNASASLTAPVARPRGRGPLIGVIIGVAVLAITAAAIAIVATNDSSRDYPKFCATAAKLDPVGGDAASVVQNTAAVGQVLSEVEQLPESALPAGAAEAARQLRADLGGWAVGGGYDSDFTPLDSALAQWDTDAADFRAIVADACDTSSSKFFAAGGPQAPTTTAPPRPVAGWATAGIHTLCVNTNASFASTALTREQVLGEAGLSTPTDSNVTGLRNRKVLVVEPGKPCDATLTISFDGSALSGDYSTGGTLYTGADMSGTLTLSTAGQPDLAYPLSHHVEPPFTTFENTLSLPKAPIDALHHIGLREPVAAAFDQWFGAT